VSVSRGLKPCLSDSLSQAQDSFEKSLAKITLAVPVSEIRHNERQIFFCAFNGANNMSTYQGVEIHGFGRRT